MADTPTPKRGLLRPPLGKKPWKEDWDYNFLKLDNDVGGIVDGSIAIGNATRFANKLPSEYVGSITGTFTGVSFFDNQIRVVKVDHSGDVIFDVPSDPVFVVSSGIRVIPEGNRDGTTDIDYGGIFFVRVENSSGSTVDGSTIAWKRKGFKV